MPAKYGFVFEKRSKMHLFIFDVNFDESKLKFSFVADAKSITSLAAVLFVVELKKLFVESFR
jgi:hypothetical protein